MYCHQLGSGTLPANAVTREQMKAQGVRWEAASTGQPEEFVRLCGVVGRDPSEILDTFDAEPWRWLIVSFAPSGYISDGARELQFPSEIRAKLDATRQYVEKPWWRRLRRR
jgi:hypothetical protein